LERSLGELRIAPPMSRAALELVLNEVLRRNRIRDGLLYLQVTRGVAPRDHVFPDAATPSSLIVTAKRVDRTVAEAKAAAGVGVITTPENRWGRCDIKTIALLPNVLAKQAAREQGAAEAWFVDADGLVTEGGASNAWIVDEAGVLRTRDTGANILRGITRKAIMDLAAELQMRVEERPFTPDEALKAREAFFTGAGAMVMPVVRIDGQMIGRGEPGPVASRLRALYVEAAGKHSA
ncbi:MAG: D-amino-acid transaminase, partial [Caulobacteraceae bacterium]|nr:D-amino-acid transaminase [Caulobacteraceae bacterium]